MAINYIFLKDVEEERVLHSKSENLKFTSYDGGNEVVNQLFDSLRSTYQENLETSMRKNILSLTQMYCKCHKVKFRRGGSDIDSPDSPG